VEIRRSALSLKQKKRIAEIVVTVVIVVSRHQTQGNKQDKTNKTHKIFH